MIKFAHNNFNVLNLEKSMAFYEEALNLKEVRRVEKPDFSLVYLGDNGETPHTLELTWLKDRKEPYNLGENEFHLGTVRLGNVYKINLCDFRQGMCLD